MLNSYTKQSEKQQTVSNKLSYFLRGNTKKEKSEIAT